MNARLLWGATLLIAPSVNAAEPPRLVLQPPETIPAREGCPRSYENYTRFGVGYTNLSLSTKVLCREDVQRWAALLIASDVQEQFMLLLHEQFLEQWNEFSDRNVSPYVAASAEINHVREEHGSESKEAIDAIAANDRRARRLRSQLIQLEHNYIDALIPILTDEQTTRLDILRNETIRRQHRSRMHPVRWSDIELRPLWMEVDSDLLSPEIRLTVDSILVDYENSLTPLVQRQAEAFWDTGNRVTPLLTQMNAGRLSIADFQARYTSIWGRFADASKHIKNLNQRVLGQIVETVGEKVGAEFTLLAKSRVFPELYPDASALHKAFAAIASDEAIDDSTRDMVQSLADSYAHAYQAITHELETTCEHWGEQQAMGDNSFPPQDLPDALKPALQQRSELSRSWLEKLSEAIGAETLERYAAHVPLQLAATNE